MDALCALLDCALGFFPCCFLFGCKSRCHRHFECLPVTASYGRVWTACMELFCLLYSFDSSHRWIEALALHIQAGSMGSIYHSVPQARYIVLQSSYRYVTSVSDVSMAGLSIIHSDVLTVRCHALKNRCTAGVRACAATAT